MVDVKIRWLIRRDMSEVLRIENESFEFPWSGEDWLRTLRMRNCIGMIAEDKDGNIIGQMVYELHRKVIRVLNFAVDPKHRRNSIGLQMVERLIDKLNQQRRTEVRFEVRESNLGALLFLRDMGFRAETQTRNAYGENGESSIDMVYRLWKGVEQFSPRNRITSFLQSVEQ